MASYFVSSAEESKQICETITLPAQHRCHGGKIQPMIVVTNYSLGHSGVVIATNLILGFVELQRTYILES